MEHSLKWERRDRTADSFYVYILKDDQGEFYVGNSRELREGLREHRDNKAPPTAGRNIKLQYFEKLSTRKAAELREFDLKRMVNSNPREIYRMIIRFQDEHNELDFNRK